MAIWPSKPSKQPSTPRIPPVSGHQIHHPPHGHNHLTATWDIDPDSFSEQQQVGQSGSGVSPNREIYIMSGTLPVPEAEESSFGDSLITGRAPPRAPARKNAALANGEKRKRTVKEGEAEIFDSTTSSRTLNGSKKAKGSSDDNDASQSQSLQGELEDAERSRKIKSPSFSPETPTVHPPNQSAVPNSSQPGLEEDREDGRSSQISPVISALMMGSPATQDQNNRESRSASFRPDSPGGPWNQQPSVEEDTGAAAHTVVALSRASARPEADMGAAHTMVAMAEGPARDYAKLEAARAIFAMLQGQVRRGADIEAAHVLVTISGQHISNIEPVSPADSDADTIWDPELDPQEIRALKSLISWYHCIKANSTLILKRVF